MQDARATPQRGESSQAGLRTDWRAVSQHAFELLLCLLRAGCGALYAVEGGTLCLVTSDGLDEVALETVRGAWSRGSRALLAGSPIDGTGPRRYLLLPCLERAEVRGVAYVETCEPRCLPTQHLCTFAMLLGRAIVELRATEGNETGSLTAAPDRSLVDIESEVWDGLGREIPPAGLVALLERNEWNVARVARILGVTRMTIYNRLRKHGVVRRRVRRGPVRGVRQAAAHNTQAATEP